ncbi:EF-P beta-lysylation protein EpmB [Methylomonas sp. EFPC3]|uniref:EF-P beta-lysylation protein EpmB n=1 Tax=Methylomonas sp. EFPC3 TaxID=3021710 RepID=UPI002415AB0F|nr:EF-P beta-lysylation protein EpmB [Methylomonas sp. EFPC3]WFP52016.1 EF-P beta-lysylation protein EpmB [Methylomonas sp. EFPC3]
MNTPSATWQQALADAFGSVADLCAYLQLSPADLNLPEQASAFPLRVPRDFAARMQAGNPDDPLLRQVLPDLAELTDYPGYTDDPVGDLKAVAETGVIHKYRGRVLFIMTGACAVHCRYCFRRNFPYGELQLSGRQFESALTYVEQRPEISEVILSGGDPLLLSDAKLEQLMCRFAEIGHIKRIRIHTRTPVVLPERVTSALLRTFAALPKPVAMVLHVNHAQELSNSVNQICTELKLSGVTLLNQSVLLKGINDDGEQLRELSEKLFSFNILPYYLHLLDRARGVGHFEVSEAEAKILHQYLQRHLPGYLVPRLVKEQAGAAFKIPIC